MSGIRDTLKGGWHPKSKDGASKESSRSNFKGINQVAGWMGKGKSHTDEAKDHVSRPLHTLKDPSAFGPPPKHVNYHGGAALPNQITPDTRGIGAPLSREEIQAQERAEEEEAQREAEEAAKAKPPPVPYRADRTGLSTANLPPPPGHKDRRPVEPVDKPKPPGLPPRLPPRQNSSHGPTALSPPPTREPATTEVDSHRGVLNQGALSRLGAAGVSVPAFGIGGAKPKSPLPPPSITPSARSSAVTSSPANSAQLGELQSRFSRLSSASTQKPETPSEGTTFAQKQAALKTASSFRNDPSSVSFGDAKAAASTANNFRERHGDQVQAGWQSANKLNTKYGIADKVGAYGGVSNVQESEPASPPIEMRDNTQRAVPGVGPLGKKKPPPPPPAKRAELAGTGLSKGPIPPPIPLSSKPKPQVSGNY
jgi:hypothetical protein